MNGRKYSLDDGRLLHVTVWDGCWYVWLVGESRVRVLGYPLEGVLMEVLGLDTAEAEISRQIMRIAEQARKDTPREHWPSLDLSSELISEQENSRSDWAGLPVYVYRLKDSRLIQVTVDTNSWLAWLDDDPGSTVAGWPLEGVLMEAVGLNPAHVDPPQEILRFAREVKSAMPHKFWPSRERK